jgi:hypothetical protein
MGFAPKPPSATGSEYSGHGIDSHWPSRDTEYVSSLNSSEQRPLTQTEEAQLDGGASQFAPGGPQSPHEAAAPDTSDTSVSAGTSSDIPGEVAVTAVSQRETRRASWTWRILAVVGLLVALGAGALQLNRNRRSTTVPAQAPPAVATPRHPRRVITWPVVRCAQCGRATIAIGPKSFRAVAFSRCGTNPNTRNGAAPQGSGTNNAPNGTTPEQPPAANDPVAQAFARPWMHKRPGEPPRLLPLIERCCV